MVTIHPPNFVECDMRMETMNRAKTVLLFADAEIAGVADDATRSKGLGARQGRDIRHVAPDEAHPEGIAVDREGNVYVVTVAANKPRTSEGTLLVFDPQAKRLRSVGIKGLSSLLLDVGFHPQTGKLLVAD
jgi:DNA-binding beta-propeller fold protein YncE